MTLLGNTAIVAVSVLDIHLHTPMYFFLGNLSILDICSTGSAEGITRKHLWRLFSLDLLNSYLERDPTPWELTYKVPTRHR